MNTFKSKMIAVLIVALVAVGAYFMGGAITKVPDTAAAATVLYDEDTVTAIYDAASPAVVEIQVSQQSTGFFNGYFQEGLGSGFLLDEQGYILTNNHVVSGATGLQVLLDDGTAIDATVVGTDAVDDLAVIKVDPSDIAGIAPLELADSDSVRPGQMAIAMGCPYGLNDTITVGIISGVDRSIDGSSGSLSGMLQTDAAISPGNSGGPLLNSLGQVIGINTAIEASNGASNIGFAIPSNTAADVLPALKAGQTVQHPWLGITGMALTSSLASELEVSVDEGVYVISVFPDSPASDAGLIGSGTDSSISPQAGGDVIIAVDGQAVKTVEELATYFRTKQVGDAVDLTVLRNGQTINIHVTLGARPDDVSLSSIPQPSQEPDFQFPWGGRYQR